MLRKFKKKHSLSSLADINVTPLIDLAFALLIIFMITTPLLEQTIPLNLPSQHTELNPPQKNEPSSFALSINKKNEYFLNKEKLSLPQLNDKLAHIQKSNPNAIIHLRADGQLPYQTIVDVLDIIKQHHLTHLSLDTQAK